MNEGGISTPLIVRWPGRIAPGSMTDQVGHIIDILPTCVELASANYPSTFGGQPTVPLEGCSLIPVIQGGTRSCLVNL
ncbi:MAG: sulfatase/phosphatase domain-containing protein, partial [bacterium]